MSTPRTDRQELIASDEGFPDYVRASFGRILEREAAALRAELERQTARAEEAIEELAVARYQLAEARRTGADAGTGGANLAAELRAECNDLSRDERQKCRAVGMAAIHNTGGAPQPWRYKAMIDWLQEMAPLALWRGTTADGTPVFEILDTDGSGRLSESADATVLGTGVDLASAIHDARNPEVEK